MCHTIKLLCALWKINKYSFFLSFYYPRILEKYTTQWHWRLCEIVLLFFYRFALQVFHLLNLNTNEDSAKIQAFTVFESLNRVPWLWALSWARRMVQPLGPAPDPPSPGACCSAGSPPYAAGRPQPPPSGSAARGLQAIHNKYGRIE